MFFPSSGFAPAVCTAPKALFYFPFSVWKILTYFTGPTSEFISSPEAELATHFSELSHLFGNTALPAVIVSWSISLCAVPSGWSALRTHLLNEGMEISSSGFPSVSSQGCECPGVDCASVVNCRCPAVPGACRHCSSSVKASLVLCRAPTSVLAPSYLGTPVTMNS